MIFDRLQTRLLMTVGLLAVTAVCAIALSARHVTRVEFTKFQEHERSPAASVSAANAVALLNGRCCMPEDVRKVVAGLAPDRALVVVDEHGRLITAAAEASSLERLQTRTEAGVLKLTGPIETAGRRQQLSLQIRGPAVARLGLPDGGAAFAYVIFLPRAEKPEPTAAFFGSIDRRLLLASGLVAALALTVVWVIVRRIAGPISALNEAAADVARGNLQRRVDDRGSDEIAELSRTFNAMTAQLARQQELQKHLVQDVVHELRTPLTTLQCRLETMLDGLAVDPRQSLQGAAEDVRHLSQLIGDLQDIAIAESRQIQLQIKHVPIAELVTLAARAVQLEHDARLRMHVDPKLMIQADALRTRQVVINLLTNASRHTPPDGIIEIRAARHDNVIALQVRNTGSSLEPEQLQRVFDRFYRCDPARQRATGGAGLGLTIVKHLVEAQGGEVTATSDATSVTIGFTLPAAPSPAGHSGGALPD